MIPGTILAEFEFHSKFRQDHLINLAGPSAKFDSSGIPGIAQILPDSGWNQWRTIKTSGMVWYGMLWYDMEWYEVSIPWYDGIGMEVIWCTTLSHHLFWTAANLAGS